MISLNQNPYIDLYLVPEIPASASPDDRNRCEMSLAKAAREAWNHVDNNSKDDFIVDVTGTVTIGIVKFAQLDHDQ